MDVRAIIRSKVQPPSIRGLTLSRSRLLDKLQAARNSRLTLLVAEAGYGKTTLLGDFEALVDARCIWYRLDSTDRDWVTIVNYLTYAIREIIPAFGGGPNGVLEQVAAGGVPKDAVIGRLVAELDVLADTPTILILDDFHTVDESEDLADVLLRMIRDGPASLRFILASRHRPELPVGRLASTGDLAELTTDDLRFSREEIGQLFAEVYGQPLDADVLGEVDDRTQGWAASLQLFYSSIRGRSTADVRGAVQALSGTTRPLYDYLAQEVLGTLTAELRGFLLRASLLERITPASVAALADEGRPDVPWPSPSIEGAERLGLLHPSSQASNAWHLHPLLRDFLRRELATQLEPAAIRAMHSRVASALMDSEPLTACHHLIEAGLMSEAMQLLGDSVLVAVGSGQWGAASDLLSRLDGVPPVPSIVTIHARRLLDEGRAEAAIQLMRDIDVSDSPPSVRAAFRQTLAAAAWRSGDHNLEQDTLQEIRSDREIPDSFREIADLFAKPTPSDNPVRLRDVMRRLEHVALAQSSEGHHHFAAISLHNAAVAATTAGEFADALRLADSALASFQKSGSRPNEIYSTHIVRANCYFELGQSDLAVQAIDSAVKDGQEQSDVPAEIALLLVITGNRQRASELLVRAKFLQDQGRGDPTTPATLSMAMALLQLPTPPADVHGLVSVTLPSGPVFTGVDLTRRTILAISLLLDGQDGEAARVAELGVGEARSLGARRAEARNSLVIAIARRDPTAIQAAVRSAAASSELALPEVADALGTVLDIVSDVPELAQSISRWPSRWLPILRRQLAGDTPVARAAAALLDKHGELSDIGLLRAFARTYRRRGRLTPKLGKTLARRVSPMLHIDDLGRARLSVGKRTVDICQIRRKPASLLMYLVTRPRHTAAREQVLDDLWPDSDPLSAMNSLNQSLYFIRRDIDPWYEDDASVDYVAYGGDVVWLDDELVTIASHDFVDWTRRIVGQKFSATEAIAHLDTYGGQFSPEFEYEEWAIGWRSHVHANYLEFVQTTIDRLVRQGDSRGAREIAIRGLAVDPSALELERRLIALHWKLGAESAALTQYQHYAAQERADDVPVTPFAALTTASLPNSP
jgi:DNA-binding SARP family transcriptional activator